MRSDGLETWNAGGDEEDVVAPDVAVPRLHGRALDDRQEVALDAFA